MTQQKKEPIEKRREELTPVELEKILHCEIFLLELTIGVKPLWNWMPCTYDGKCYFQKEKEAHQPKPCRYNPKMFQCPAYQNYKNLELQAREA